MSDKSNEQISQLMDGELEINASRFLLKRLAADQALSNKWEGYHLIKSCLQKKADEPLIFDVAQQVCQRLENEQRHGQQPEELSGHVTAHRWLKPLLGAGIAASVAIMSVFMLQQNQQTEAMSVKPVVNVANDIQPMKTNISANVATSGKSILPPVSLSRFPSAAQSLNKQHQGFSQHLNVPYLIINQTPEKAPYSPIRIQDISD